MGNQNYNPFKMCGSWIGLIIFSIPTLFLWWWLIAITPFCDGEFCSDSNPIIHLTAFLLPLITGFLVGWGIHSFIRKIKCFIIRRMKSK